jgi:ABC-type lipoprotein release transport system permease subunit
MRTTQLIQRSLAYYWRTNLAVVLGVAIAVAVLAGALVVGDSVRTSLRDLVVQRLGNTDQVITSQEFVREQLATDLQSQPQFAAAGFSAACPLIALDGTITHENTRRVATSIRVYGVDERFWKFHGLADASPREHDVLLSESLARELGANNSDSLLLRVEKPSEIPIESLHSRKEDLGSTVRLTLRETLPATALGEFSVQPQQGVVRSAFVPLSLLQRSIAADQKANLILLSATSHEVSAAAAKAMTLQTLLKERLTLEDYGVKLRPLSGQQSIALETDSKVINDSLAQAADKAAGAMPVHKVLILSYLANGIRFGERSIPYSLVTAVDEETFAGLLSTHKFPDSESLPESPPPIILNEWAAHDLSVLPDDLLSLDYYVWHEGGHLETQSAQFRLIAVEPISGLAADRDLVPDYPGISSSENLADWDPPFPVDLKRVRKQDEDYWHQYRTTPKAFIPLEVGQKLWQTRFGKLTSMRFVASNNQNADELARSLGLKLTEALSPEAMGILVMPVRDEGLSASRGATDFGEYFLYFSFFLVVSALLLTALFFKLGIEQRLREIGLYQAVGFSAATIRRLFLIEGLVLAVIGSAIGLLGAIAYGQLLMLGLRTWWVEAVGTTMLRLHVTPSSLLLGTAGGVFASLLCIVWTLRQVGRSSTRSLLTGIMGDREQGRRRERDRSALSPHLLISLSPRLLVAFVFTALGLLLLVAASLHLLGQTAGFFGGGTLLLIALLCYQSVWLRRDGGSAIVDTGWWSITRLGFRNATSKAGRSVLCIALIASAAFIIVAVDSFRHRGETATLDKQSGTGGFPLLAQSLLPLVHDPNTLAGREALNLSPEDAKSPLQGVTFSRFRVRPGDDASCLNLYQPRTPKIIAPTGDFIPSKRFAFQNSLAGTADEKSNPWLLLNKEFPDGAVPVIADANSLTYVLHLKLGDDLVLQLGKRPLRLRVVAALSDSIFQSELVMSEQNFLRHFPEQEGYRFFLIDTSQSPNAGQPATIATALEERLGDYGFDAQSTGERLASFHRVENTYLSTFQMLGGLGLLLGTLGMAAVLLRNVLERRRELALLRAVGYNSGHFTLMVVAENALLLCGGLLTGTICALLAIAPVFFSQHARLSGISLGLLLLAVLISGLTASIVATWSALRSPLLPALRAE